MFTQVTKLCPVFPLDSLLSNTVKYSQREVKPLKGHSSCVIHMRTGFSEKSSVFKLIIELKSIKLLNCYALVVQF